METLLSKRSKNIIYFIVLGIFLVLLSITILSTGKDLNSKDILASLSANIKDIEKKVDGKIRSCLLRGDRFYNKYQSGSLEHTDFLRKEALIIEDKGFITDYFGEIFFFKFIGVPTGEWKLIRKNQDIYIIKKYTEHIYYVSFLFDIENNSVLNNLKYPFLIAELKFFDVKLKENKDTFQYDRVKDIFFFTHSLKPLNNQFVLFLKFSKEDIHQFSGRKNTLLLLLLILIFLLFNYWILNSSTFRFKGQLKGSCFLSICVAVYLIVFLYGQENLYLTLLNMTINSIFEIAVFLVFLLFLVWITTKKIKRAWNNQVWGFLLFNGLAVAVLLFSDKILKSINFYYSGFNFDLRYLTLILVVFLLHLFPILVIYKNPEKNNLKKLFIFLLLQMMAVGFMILIFKISLINVLLFSVIFLVVLFLKKNFLSHILLIFLISVSIFYLLFTYSLMVKKEFVSHNLKNIFSNQGNYAKFLAREIVHEINSHSSDFNELFEPDKNSKLAEIWRNSLASKENVASGIFVVSKDNVIVNFFQYQTPFIEVKKRDFFPFWAVEEIDATLYGKDISLAIASISVFKKSLPVGHIIVQVLNSPELILRDRENINIFSIDRRIEEMDLSYIKLDQNKKILENPSNINLTNITGKLKFIDQWITFNFIDLEFEGYIFKQNNDSIIIFYPENTLFKNLSDAIKIFLFFMVILLLFYFKELKKIKWKRIYFSFSLRVFFILILISLLTAIIFSIFSINFNARSSEQHLREIIFERGRTAQNIVNNIIGEEGEFNQNHLFFLSKIIGSDVNVYQNGILLFTSDYKKIIRSQIPIYLHSHTLSLLNEKNQKFDLEREKKSFNLFFKTYDYIFNIDFAYRSSDILSGKETYFDFIIALFFILVISGFSASFFFRNKILAPIYGLNKGMEEVEKGNLLPLKKVPREIELRSLYEGFNAMVQGIKEQKKNISEISRMKTLLKLGRRVAHEVKNPLTPIKLSAQQIQESLKDKRSDYEKIIKKSVRFIIDEAEHLKKVSYGFLDFSRLDEIKTEEFNILNTVSEEISSFISLYPKVSFNLTSEGENFKVVLDKLKIKQVIKNILINSIEAIGDKSGEVNLYLKDKDNRLVLKIIDNGVGFDRQELDLIFNEDYSTKEIGTGLGLFIVKRIVDLHQGRIEIKSEKNQGTTVILNLPKNVSKTG